MTTIIELHARDLRTADSNVRKVKASEQQDAELRSSIEENGVLQNLIVSPWPEGGHQVHAGARRLAAVQALITAGTFEPDFTVPCLVVDTEEQAAELSLAENAIRASMHPVDEYEAFSKLTKTHLPETIAAHFGKSVSEVKKLLALGGCAPRLLDACRAGEINVDALRVFTLTNDHQRQLAVYEQLREKRQLHDWYIRKELTGEAVKGDQPMAMYVGKEAYLDAGGTLSDDLFSDSVYFHNGELLSKLAHEKAEAELKEQLGEGWNWTEINLDLQDYEVRQRPKLSGKQTEETEELDKQIEEVLARVSELDELIEEKELQEHLTREEEAQMEAWDKERDDLYAKHDSLRASRESTFNFSDSQKKKSGAIARLGDDGTLIIHPGIQTPDQVKGSKKEEASPGSKSEESDKPPYSLNLVEDLQKYKTEIARLALVNNPMIAVELLHFQITVDTLRDYAMSVLHVDLRDAQVETQRKDITSQAARKERNQALEQLLKDVPEYWLKKVDSADLVDAFIDYAAWPDILKLRALAHGTAKALAVDNRLSGYLLNATGIDIRSYWHPTKDNLFSRISLDTCLECAVQILGETLAEPLQKLNKKDLAIRLEEICCSEEVGKHWIPDPMVTPMGGEPAEDEGQDEAA